MTREKLQGQNGHNTWSSIKMPFGRIYYIGWLGNQWSRLDALR